MATREELVDRADAVLSMNASGDLDVRVHASFPSARADEAHRLLQSRTTAGKVVLVTGRGEER